MNAFRIAKRLNNEEKKSIKKSLNFMVNIYIFVYIFSKGNVLGNQNCSIVILSISGPPTEKDLEIW